MPSSLSYPLSLDPMNLVFFSKYHYEEYDNYDRQIFSDPLYSFILLIIRVSNIVIMHFKRFCCAC